MTILSCAAIVAPPVQKPSLVAYAKTVTNFTTLDRMIWRNGGHAVSMGIPIILNWNCALNILTEDSLAVPRINECERIYPRILDGKKERKREKKKKGGRSGIDLKIALSLPSNDDDDDDNDDHDYHDDHGRRCQLAWCW
jgi:hypothetical protein